MYPLHYKRGHLFVQIEQSLWLLDTGSPTSFGDTSALCMQGRVFRLPAEHQGVTVHQLRAYLGVDCDGLLGADIISQFDLLLDVPGGSIEFTAGEVKCGGQEIALAHYMGIPVFEAIIAGRPYDMFFDTGAQLSYLQDEVLVDFPEAGIFRDFHHGYGDFEVQAHHVPIIIGNRPYNMRFGRLPELLGGAVLSQGPRGIVGNEWMLERRIGYFPGRGVLIIDPVTLASYDVAERGGDQSYIVH